MNIEITMKLGEVTFHHSEPIAENERYRRMQAERLGRQLTLSLLNHYKPIED